MAADMLCFDPDYACISRACKQNKSAIDWNVRVKINKNGTFFRRKRQPSGGEFWRIMFRLEFRHEIKGRSMEKLRQDKEKLHAWGKHELTKLEVGHFRLQFPCKFLDLTVLSPKSKQFTYNLFEYDVFLFQGNQIHWLACALYEACRRTKVPTVGRGTVEGNCVSLTRLLRSSKFRYCL